MTKSERKTQRRIIIWGAFVLVCVAAGGLRVLQNHQYRVRLVAWKVRCDRFAKLDEHRCQQMIGLFNNADLYATIASMPAYADERTLYDRIPETPGKRPTARQVETLFNSGQPLKLVQGTSWFDLPKWTDPLTGRVWEMRFVGGKWTGYGTSGPPPGPPQPMPTKFDQIAETLRRRFVHSWGPLIWITLVLVYLLWRYRRGLVAELLVGLAIVYTMASLVEIYYPTDRVTFSNATLGGILMLFISAGLVGIAYYLPHASRPVEPLCETCGYNLTGNVSGVCPECGAKCEP